MTSFRQGLVKIGFYPLTLVQSSASIFSYNIYERQKEKGFLKFINQEIQKGEKSLATVKYSTGPIINMESSTYPSHIYSTIEISVLNNSKTLPARVSFRRFKLNGVKQLIGLRKRRVGPKVSKTEVFNVSNLDSFEFEVVIRQRGSFNKVKKTVLVTAIGRDAAGQFVNRLPLKIII